MRKTTGHRAFRLRRATCRVEPLEDRVLLSTFTVANTNDTGTGCLRQAILDANGSTGANTIVFASLFSSSPHTITFMTPTPQINGQLAITGPGASLLTVTHSGIVGPSSNVFNSFASQLTMSGMTVTGGDINADGGGLSIHGVTPNVTLDSMIFTGNTSETGNGGAISLGNNGTLTITNCTISNNTANALGGGIFFFQSGSLVMQNCTISGNHAEGTSQHDASGGGIYFEGTALASPPAGFTANTLLVQNSTFNGNIAAHGGGGIATDGLTGTLLLQNCTLTNNTAGTSGGGVWCSGTTATVGSVTLQDCTVATNTASGTAAGIGGGGVARVGSFAGSITLLGTIVFNNTNTNAPDILASSFTTTNANFCDIGTSAGYALSGSSGSNLPIGANPLLGGLAVNGGPTQTMALLPGSPCINAGTTITGITTDQRGTARPQGSAPDIGAYERQSTTATLQSMSYEFQTRQAITFSFNGDASVTFTRNSYTIVNQTTSHTLASSAGALSFNAAGTQATLVLTNLLADGNYHVTSGAVTLDFFVLLGDADHERHVNVADLADLAGNFGKTTGMTLINGDFDYNGNVNVADLADLAGNFGKTLAAASGSSGATPAIAAPSPATGTTADVAAAGQMTSAFNDLTLIQADGERELLKMVGLE